jgi:amino-acid N-acetyltransferase
VAECNGLVGVAGVEIHGREGLLRSVAVGPAWRGRAVGARLVRERLAWARAARLARIYLLTIDAAGYFERLGFIRVDQDAVPDEIKACPEFTSLCPNSAIVMMMRLEQDPGASR